ncbi:hypothetical protein HOG98_10320 [bacterium]|nr:hypothetical protein [Candidatus Woesearchaeota archaeon]MBT5955098.1 hypothetical protein [bacterium]
MLKSIKSNLVFFLLSLFLFLSYPVSATETDKATIKEIGIFEELGVTPNFGFSVSGSNGVQSLFGDAIDSTLPTVLQFGYFTCPMLCGLVSNGLLEVVNECSLDLGKDYQIASISISDFDTVKTIDSYSRKYKGSLEERHENTGWKYFIKAASERKTTSNIDNELDVLSIDGFAKEVGFNYKYLVESGEYAHSAGLIVLSPSGIVTRYLYGAQFSEFDFKMAIIEAKDDKVRSSIERVLVFCYNYDPQKQGYSIQAMKVMRVGSGVFLVLLLLGIIRIVKRKKNESKSR